MSFDVKVAQSRFGFTARDTVRVRGRVYAPYFDLTRKCFLPPKPIQHVNTPLA